MNKIKRIFASLMVAATVGAVSISAATYSNPSYSLNISYKSYAWSAAAVKEDTSNSAAVHSTGGNVSSTKPVYVTIYSDTRIGNVDRVSGTILLTSNSQDKTITYTDTVSQNKSYYILGETGAYSATVSGYWNP